MIPERFSSRRKFFGLARRMVRELLICVALPSILLVSFSVVAQKADSSPPQQRTDEQIAIDVNNKIQASDVLRPLNLGVGVDNSVATLSGTVSTPELRRQAADLVQSVPGIKSVDDQITIGSASANLQAAPQQGPGEPPPPPRQDEQENYPPAGQGQNAQQNYPPPQYPQQNGPPPPQQGYGQNGPPPPSGQDEQENYPPAGQGQNAQQNYPPPQYPQQNGPPPQQGYGQNGPPPPNYPAPGQQRMVTVSAGTPITVMMLRTIDSRHTRPGLLFRGVVVRDVIVMNGATAIPRGAYVEGTVIDSRGPGHLKGHPKLALQLDHLNVGDDSYPMTSLVWARRGPGKGGQTAGTVGGSAVVGAIVGGAVGGGPTALLGGLLGGLGGAGLSAASRGPQLLVPAESVLTFTLSSPVVVREPTYNEMRALDGNVPAQNYPPPGYGSPGYGPPGYPPPGPGDQPPPPQGPPGGYPY